MDRIDRRILALLQLDAELPLSEVAERVGLSKNPCWRRVQKLKQLGVIRQTVALLDPEKLNVGITVFVNIRTNTHSIDWLQRFAAVIREIPEVVEFYRMSGNVDYLLKIVVPTIQVYDQVYKRIIADVELFDVSSNFAMEELKNTTALPLEYL